MHEMGIANSVLEMVQEKLRRFPRHRATRVGLRVGEHAGVDRDSLEFCFEAIVKGSEFEGLNLDIEWCPAGIGHTGQELDMAYLELDDSQEAAA